MSIARELEQAALDLPFLKVSAGGNDFVLVDNRNSRLSGDLAPLVRAICHRRLGIGGDGMILVEGSSRADLRMTYHNRDGGAASLCGNGVRCVARWAALAKAAPMRLTIETGAGVLEACGTDEPPWFTLPLGPAPARAIALEAGGRRYEGVLVQAGVPHVAFRAEEAFAPGVLGDAPALRAHRDLGESGANVDFYSEREGGLIDAVYFERGVEAETLSSGTGSIAVAVAASHGTDGTGPFTCRNREGLESKVFLERHPGGAISARLAGPVAILYHGRLRRGLFEAAASRNPGAETGAAAGR